MPNSPVAINRRRLLALSTSSLAIESLDIKPARADIILFGVAFTVYEVLSLLFAIIGVVWSYISGMAVQSQLVEINKRLDAILGNEILIMREIDSLKLYFDQALWNAFKQDADFDITAYKYDFDIFIRDGWKIYGKSNALNLSLKIEHAAFKASLYDFSTCIPFLLGAVMSITIRRAISRPISEVEIVKAQFIAILSSWLDPNNTTSGLPTAITINNKAISDKLAMLPQGSGPWLYPDNTYYQNGGAVECRITDGWRVDGSFQSGYVGNRARISTDCHERPVPGGHNHYAAIFKLGAGPPIPDTPVTSLKPDYTGIPDPTAPASSDPFVNNINAIRADIINLQRHARDLTLYQSVIQGGVQALASR